MVAARHGHNNTKSVGPNNIVDLDDLDDDEERRTIERRRRRKRRSGANVANDDAPTASPLSSSLPPTTMDRATVVISLGMRTIQSWQWRLTALFHHRLLYYSYFGIDSPILTVTFGQVFLTLPLVICTIITLYLTFWSPSTSQSGLYAYYVIVYVFILSFKKAAVIQVLFQISWEQLVPVHRLASLVAVILSLLHVYVAYTGHDYIPCREPWFPDVIWDDRIAAIPLCESMEEHRSNHGNDATASVTTTTTSSAYAELDDQHNHNASSASSSYRSYPDLHDKNDLLPPPSDRRQLGELRLEDNPRFRYSLVGDEPNLWQFVWDGGRNISGSYMLLMLLALIVTSAWRNILRRPCFDLWLMLHIALVGALLAYSDKHRVQLFTVLVVWWALDGLLRYGLGTLLQLPKTATLRLIPTTSTSTLLQKKRGGPMAESDDPDDDDDDNANIDDTIVELTLDRKFHYTAGQYVRIAVLETGQPVSFHPISISSAPYQDNVTLHFRPFGGWTRQLARMAAQHHDRQQQQDQLNRKDTSSNSSASSVHTMDASISGGKKVHVLLEGPYGNLSMNLWNIDYSSVGRSRHHHSTVILIAGGIGITPMTSVVRQLLHDHRQGQRLRKMIRVVWAVRDMGLVDAMPLLDDDDYGVGNKNYNEGCKGTAIGQQGRQDSPEARIMRRFIMDPEGGVEVFASRSDDNRIDVPLFAADVYLTSSSTSTKTKLASTTATAERPSATHRAVLVGTGRDGAIEVETQSPPSPLLTLVQHQITALSRTTCCSCSNLSDAWTTSQTKDPHHRPPGGDNEDDSVDTSRQSSPPPPQQKRRQQKEQQQRQRQSQLPKLLPFSSHGIRDERGYTFHRGRPDVDQILLEAVTNTERLLFGGHNVSVDGGHAHAHHRIAVLACGPPSLVRAAHDACVRLSTSHAVPLDFHEEVFLY
jgi:hypothetical protein